MKTIQQTRNKYQWPRKATKIVETRKRDLVIRIANWMRDKDEPAYDVELYIGGVYDWNESKTFAVSSGRTRQQCKADAIAFAQSRIAKLL